jgi:hypothetical protein
VIHRRKECGTIIYESKNSKAWRDDYVTKLRKDQMAEKAQHAILSTYKLPAGAQQLAVQDGVIIAVPERVLVLADILRREIIRNHELRVSSKEQGRKTEVLYSYITSPSFNQDLDSIDTQTKKMRDLDASEEKAHKKLWRKRENLIKSMQDAQSKWREEINEIIAAE